MEQHILRAVKLYSGDKPIALFAQRLESNLNKLNAIYAEIAELFAHAGVADFHKLPDDLTVRGKFSKQFKSLNDYLEAAKIQGFKWSQLSYEFKKNRPKTTVTLTFDENTYLILALRYKELYSGGGGGGGDGVPYEIDGYLTQIDTGVIDADYMNSRFEKFLKTLKTGDSVQVQATLDELHKSFASLTQQEQKYASIFLHDVQSGNIVVAPNKTLRDYITEYQFTAKDGEIQKLVLLLGVDETKLRAIINTGVTEANINEYGRFDTLKGTVDASKAKAYFENIEGKSLPPFRVNIKAHQLLQEFIIKGGFEL